MRPHGGPLGLDHGNADPLAGGLEIILWNGPPYGGSDPSRTQGKNPFRDIEDLIFEPSLRFHLITIFIPCGGCPFRGAPPPDCSSYYTFYLSYYSH